MITLRNLLAISIGSLTCGVVALALMIVGDAGTRRIEQEIGRSLAQLADQMQDRVDRFLFERLQQIRSSAKYISPLIERHEEDLAKQLIDNVKSAHPDFSWIGLVDRDGRTLIASGPNANVSARRWFRVGLREANVGQVHRPTLTERMLFARSQGGAKFIDISVPVRNSKGQVIAVLGGKLNLGWVNEARDALFGITPNVKTDVLVVTPQGSVIIGPPEMLDERIPLQQVWRAAASASPFNRSVWPSGVDYVTGYARSDGYRNFKGLGWIVLVRQTTHEALSPVRNLRRAVLAWGIGISVLGALAAWFLSGVISRPMIALAVAAEDLRLGGSAAIPNIQTFHEAAILSASMRALVLELNARRAALETINKTLELQVRERTKELEERNRALIVAREDAVQATKAKSRFIAAASHDLRQPLHAMTLLGRALSRRISAGEPAQLMGQLEISLNALKRMFDLLLDISRLDSGLIQPQIETFRLMELIERVAADTRVDADARGLKFRTRASDVVVRTDPVIIETMLRNLVANALKFTKMGGILLAVRSRGNRVMLEVYDTGPGIPEERLGQVFVEFDRAREHATGTNEGLGLGLSIVKRYGELLGIEISVCSRMGRGTRFSMLLPVQALIGGRAGDTALAKHNDEGKGRSLAGLRVLVADDDKAIVAALRQDLEDQGCLVRELSSAEDLDRQINNIREIDVAVVDYHLWEGQNGLEVLTRLETFLGRPISALIVSGATDPETLSSILSSGRPLLTKPMNSETISTKLGELMGCGLCSRRVAGSS